MPKNMTFAILEGVQSERQREKWLTLLYDETQGIRAVYIDARTLEPLEGAMEPILESVKKTGRLLPADEGSCTFCNGTEIVARVAEALPGTKVKRLALPDAPTPGAPEVLNHMRAGCHPDRGGGVEAGQDGKHDP